MYNPVEQFNQNRKSEVETLIVAVLMATGVNIFVSGIAMPKSNNSYFLVIAGLIVIILALTIFRYQFIATSSTHKRFRGFFVYNTEKREIIDVPNYDIAMRMWIYMRSASDEIQRVWKNNVLGNTQFVSGKLCEEKTESDRIVSELLEYCVLEILTTSLMDYYDDINKRKLKTLGRDDVPDVLQNRFLYWYSLKPEGIDDYKKYLEFDGCTVEEAFLKSAKDARSMKPYSRFELVLPKSTNISRKDGKIVIDDPLFSLTMKCSFGGNNAITPINFERLYLGIDANDNSIKPFAMSVDVTIMFKAKCLLFPKKIKEYAWIDNFLNNLDRMLSEDYYYKKIGWGTAETVIRCIETKDES